MTKIGIIRCMQTEDYCPGTADFMAKMQIALKETSETEYWLELLEETEYISENAGKSMHEDCEELLKMITAILKTTKDNQSK